MNAEETIAALQAELAAARETLAVLTGQVAALLERVKDLEGQRATTSRNSSKSPYPADVRASCRAGGAVSSHQRRLRWRAMPSPASSWPSGQRHRDGVDVHVDDAQPG